MITTLTSRQAEALPDLRRRRERAHTQLIVTRAAWLMPDERSLVRTVFEEAKTVAEVARLARESPREVRRRVRRLVARVTAPAFAFVADHRDAWPAPRRQIATSVILQGRTLRETSRFLRLPYHTVRTEMNVVAALMRQG